MDDLTPQQISDELNAMYERLEVLKDRLDWLNYHEGDPADQVRVVWQARAVEATDAARTAVGKAHTTVMVAHGRIRAAPGQSKRMDPKRKDYDWNWHVGINRTVEALGYEQSRFMYDAKEVAEESQRLPYWFARERTGTMPKLHRQCSHSEPEIVADNHLTCCLGVECRTCPFLQKLEAESRDVPPEEMDKFKTWTCITHIMTVKAQKDRFVDTSEGFILTTGDRMFRDNVYRSMWDEEPEL